MIALAKRETASSVMRFFAPEERAVEEQELKNKCTLGWSSYMHLRSMSVARQRKCPVTLGVLARMD